MLLNYNRVSYTIIYVFILQFIKSMLILLIIVKIRHNIKCLIMRICALMLENERGYSMIRNRKNTLLLAILTVISTTGVTYGQDIEINSWNNLKDNSTNYDNKYILQNGVSAGDHIKIGSWDSETKGNWNLDGNNVELSRGYSSSGFSIENNINSFVFENLNISEFKNGQSQGSGAVFWNGGNGGVLKNSTIRRSGTNSADGGVIYNNTSASFDSISNSIFENNFVDNANGGVIYNNGTITTISSSEFNHNGVYDGGALGGGAIYNNSKIGTIEDSKFQYNALRGFAKNGAAIFNAQDSSITTIKNSTFLENGKNTDGNDYASVGGAIYNKGVIGNENDTTSGIIGGSFTGNEAQYGGGAIFNEGTIYNISGVTFKENYSGDDGGGAIKNLNYIASITNSVFDSNRASTDLGNDIDAKGAAIYNVKDSNSDTRATIDEITSCEFYSNLSEDFGGAVSNFGGYIGKIDNSIFGAEGKGNQGASAGALNNQRGGTIDAITNSTFAYNKALEPHDFPQGFGGAIVNRSYQDVDTKINLIDNVKFLNNESRGLNDENQGDSGYAYGGAIHNMQAEIGAIKNSTFSENKVIAGEREDFHGTAKGGAIANVNGDIERISGHIKTISDSTFIKNEASGSEVYGGAIYNECIIGKINENGEITDGIVNSSFIGNHADTENGTAKGGAIYTSTDLNIIANNGKASTFSGNYTKVGDTVENNAIYVDSLEESDIVTLNLDASDKAKIIFDDTIDGNKYNLKLSGNKSGEIYINNKISNADISQKDVTSIVNEASNLNYNNTLAIESGVMNIMHLGMNEASLSLNSFSNNGTININSVDVDIAGEQMGQITADSYGSMNGTINVNGLNILTNPVKDKTNIMFADKAFSNTVKYNGAKEYASNVYKYGITYLPETGEFEFLKGAGNSPSSAAAYNPALYVSSVATQVGGFLTQSQTLQDAFYHMNRYSKYTKNMRLMAETSNSYAVTEGSTYNNSSIPETSSAMWVKPYTAFEKVNLKGGIGVSNITYGTLYGGDTDLVNLGHGFKGVVSAFVGYNGAHQTFNGISMNQQGGTLGATGTLYKGNFFTGLTVSAGASSGEAYTTAGRDNFAMLTSGIASKSGYNWEIKEGKVIVQPSLFVGYTFANTFNYINSSGAKIHTDPLHAIQIIPGLKFIGNTKNGWQPYAGVDMVWNIMGQKHIMANDVRLPQLSVKPYIQYGVGIQKSWANKFTAFGQTMIRNGGRNGIVLQAGFRWILGKITKNDTVKNNIQSKVVINQLSPTQKSILKKENI